jgi:hypothetical protein
MVMVFSDVFVVFAIMALALMSWPLAQRVSAPKRTAQKAHGSR